MARSGGRLGGISILRCWGRANLRRVKKLRWAAQRGAGMIRILHDLLLFSCLAAFVTGIVVAAAALLI